MLGCKLSMNCRNGLIARRLRVFEALPLAPQVIIFDFVAHLPTSRRWKLRCATIPPPNARKLPNRTHIITNRHKIRIGSRHIITIRNANISWIGWMRPTDMLTQFDGDIYGIEFSRATTAAARQGRETAMAA